jgi:hypothetical protein
MLVACQEPDMPTTLPVVRRDVYATNTQKPLGIFTDDFFAVALFSGIGLLATLIAIICGEQGSWF